MPPAQCGKSDADRADTLLVVSCGGSTAQCILGGTHAHSTTCGGGRHVGMVAVFYIFLHLSCAKNAQAAVGELGWRGVSCCGWGVTRHIQQVSVCSASDTRSRVSSLLSTPKRVLGAASWCWLWLSWAACSPRAAEGVAVLYDTPLAHSTVMQYSIETTAYRPKTVATASNTITMACVM